MVACFRFLALVFVLAISCDASIDAAPAAGTMSAAERLAQLQAQRRAKQEAEVEAQREMAQKTGNEQAHAKAAAEIKAKLQAESNRKRQHEADMKSQRERKAKAEQEAMAKKEAEAKAAGEKKAKEAKAEDAKANAEGKSKAVKEKMEAEAVKAKAEDAKAKAKAKAKAEDAKAKAEDAKAKAKAARKAPAREPKTKVVDGADPDAHYLSLEEVDLPSSLEKIRKLQLNSYYYKFDMVPGRRQIGPIGPDLKKVLPEVVTVHKTHPLPNPQRNGPKIINVENYHSIDYNMLMMHSMAATQELGAREESLTEEVSELKRLIEEEKVDYDSLDSQLAFFSKEKGDGFDLI